MPRKTVNLENPEDRNIILDRLKLKSIYEPSTDCWLWQGFSNGRGYGEIRFGQKPLCKKYYVHRISAFLFLELDIKDETVQVNHQTICPNTNCWNFVHLYLGTQKDNMKDALDLGYKPGENQRIKTHCPQGHEYNEKNTRYYKNERNCITCSKERYLKMKAIHNE